jgi:hypothetical protein
MKYFIIVFLLFFGVSAHAQITLEHTYNGDNSPVNSGGLGLVEVDSGIWKYVQLDVKVGSDTTESILIFNLDHSLDKVISVPNFANQFSFIFLLTISKNLFDLDGTYDYALSYSFHEEDMRIFKEDGTLLFACDSCNLTADYAPTYETPSSIISTDSGLKMIIRKLVDTAQYYKVYSLPGKLPNRASKTAVVTPSIAYNGSLFPSSAYPNPSNGQVRIAYELPSGVSSGDLILTTDDGREVKRYHVTSAFSDLLIETSDLPSGSYFYKLVTEKGESQAQRIVMTK